jgi:hypothetical protein
MYIKYYNQPTDAPLDNIAGAFTSTPYQTMYYLKYPFTILSIVGFYFLSFLSVKYIGYEKKLLKWLTYTYALLLSLAGISMLFGLIVHQRLQDDEYTLSRWLLGIAQSPLIALIILASGQLIHLKEKETQDKTHY